MHILRHFLEKATMILKKSRYLSIFAHYFPGFGGKRRVFKLDSPV